MRILTLPADFPISTHPVPGVFVLRHLQALCALGHSVRVLRVIPYAPPLTRKWRAYRSIPTRYEFEGIEVKTIRAFVPPRNAWLDIVRRQVAGRIQAEIADFKADIVHAHFLIPPGFFVRDVRVPSVLTAWGSDAYNWVWARRDLHKAGVSAVRAATSVCAVSGFIAERVKLLGRTDVRVVFMGADERTFFPSDRQQARIELALDLNRPVIAFAGTVHAPKGVFDLAHAVAELTDLHPIVLIAGDGPQESALTAVFKEARVDARFLGVVSHSKLARVLAAASVFVLPSHGEGLPAVVCEAMLAGCCVVASAVGGIPEVIKQDETGRLVPVGDARALARSLHEILTNQEMRGYLENRARAFALDNLTWRANARSYVEVYQRARELFARKASGPRVSFDPAASSEF